MSKLFLYTSSQYLTVNSAPVTAAPFSVSCWYRPTSLSANQTLISIGDVDATNEQWRLSINTLGRARWSAQTSTGESFATYTTTTISAGAWGHFGGVEAAANNHIVYFNGGSNNNTSSRSPAGADTLRIGARASTTPADFADGDITEVGIWNVDLTAAEMAILAAGYSPLFVRPESLVFYMPLVRNDVEVIGGLALTAVNSPTVSAHPRVFYPGRPYVGLPAAAGGGTITETVNQSAETDTAQTFTSMKAKQLGQNSEADTAQAIARLKTLAIAQASETDSVQSITVLKTAAVGQVSETDTAQAFTRLKTLAIGQTTETDTAQTITPSGAITATVNQVSETDTAQPMTALKTLAIGQAAEADTAQAIGKIKTLAIGQTAEIDTAQAITWGPKHRLVGQVSEVDFAQAITLAILTAYVLSDPVIVPNTTAAGVKVPAQLSEAVIIPASI